ncbi:hypothetical protein, partial [Mycobacterium bouchedurhonense]|uniref:hypothetical protein n=1 Tax=Mycobacterium bouchedurhonense TaxID=701041 RepID=UPI001ABF748A
KTHIRSRLLTNRRTVRNPALQLETSSLSGDGWLGVLLPAAIADVCPVSRQEWPAHWVRAATHHAKLS